MKFRMTTLALASAVALGGCISVKSYVDPTYAKASYEDLNKSAQVQALKVNVEFSRNGERLPKADNELRGHVERVLRGSGLITPSDSAANGEITITVDNVGDIGKSVAKGFGTGLTFGLAGSTVQDGYVMTVTLSSNGKTTTKADYKHVLITTVGNKKGPEGLTPTTPGAAFGTIVEQMLLNSLSDFQKDGLLVQADDRLPRRHVMTTAASNSLSGFLSTEQGILIALF
jgi:hypothetical protein